MEMREQTKMKDNGQYGVGWSETDRREKREMLLLMAKQTQPDGNDHNELDL